MNVERSILTTFLGNYLINTVIIGLVALIPESVNKLIFSVGNDQDPSKNFYFTVQYLVVVVLAAALVGYLSWRYIPSSSRNIKGGLVYGGIGFVVAILTAFLTGIAGTLVKYGAFSAVVAVLPNFLQFLVSLNTLFTIAYWIIPAALVGWYLDRKAVGMSATSK